VLLPGGVLVALGLLVTPSEGAYVVDEIGAEDAGLVLMLAFTAGGALATARPRNHLTLVLTLAAVGYGLAAVYAFAGAPDVALVAVLVETVLALLFFGVFALLPREALRREENVAERPSRRWRDPLIAAVSGGAAFVVVWGALSRPAPEASVAEDHLRLADDAHAQDAVTAIIADFRGLDTLGEVTVVAVALLGVAALLRGGRLT
jgi:multicomponent Na+:H+ antiporter subunit A